LDNSKTLIVDNQYFACINYYLSLFASSDVKIEAFENYRKMSFRNRCVVTGSNGLICLSVPLKNGRDQKRLIREVKIDNRQKWQRQHWHTLFSCYGKSPFFEFYRDAVELFFKKEFTYLFDLNLEILDWFRQTIKVPSEINLTGEFIDNYPPEIKDDRHRWLPKNFQEDKNFVKYNQVFEDRTAFQPNLSILDILFCEGPETNSILKRYAAGKQQL
jgi:hypothetical protein